MRYLNGDEIPQLVREALDQFELYTTSTAEGAAVVILPRMTWAGDHRAFF